MARRGSRKGARPEEGGANQAERKLEYIPFGGMGEIGKNMAAFRYEDEILMVDGGLAFPDADMLGVDILVPKIDWLVEHAHQIKGWVLTHGHEDHIGGLPYMLKQLPKKIPMYGAKLTLGLLRGKFEEFKLKESDVDLREVTTGRADQDRHALHRRHVPHDPLDPRQLGHGHPHADRARSSTPATSSSTTTPPTARPATCTRSPRPAATACCC
jgi:hypothetical protein